MATGLRVFGVVNAPGTDNVWSVAEVQASGTAVPEPASMLLMGGALAAAALRRKRGSLARPKRSWPTHTIERRYGLYWTFAVTAAVPFNVKVQLFSFLRGARAREHRVAAAPTLNVIDEPIVNEAAPLEPASDIETGGTARDAHAAAAGHRQGQGGRLRGGGGGGGGGRVDGQYRRARRAVVGRGNRDRRRRSPPWSRRNTAVVDPAGTVTLDGTPAEAGLLLDSATTPPPAVRPP